MSIAAVVSRLSPIQLITSNLPRFSTSRALKQAGWADLAASSETTALNAWLSQTLKQRQEAGRPIRCIIFGEQHHQPRVLAAELQLIHCLATALSLRCAVVLEHFNITQQDLLTRFASDGDIDALRNVYAKSSEGFRLSPQGYLPLLSIIRELPNVTGTISAGFPPREWARVVMKDGVEVARNNPEIRNAPNMDGFDRWEDLTTTAEHAAYIRSSISGNMPELPSELQTGGLNAAQAFKDAIMAWRMDQLLEVNAGLDDVVVGICGSGHAEYDFGVTERIRNCSRDQMLLIVTKPNDGLYWYAADNNQTSHETRQIADAIFVYEAVDV
ncbi:hypothetical protein EMMF5_003665 [Cystobasidiomycetes sp. EMM_F5]